MRYLFTFAIFLAIPLILCAILFAVALPLFVQHFFRQRTTSDALVYPYLTSWEAAA